MRQLTKPILPKLQFKISKSFFLEVEIAALETGSNAEMVTDPQGGHFSK